MFMNEVLGFPHFFSLLRSDVKEKRKANQMSRTVERKSMNVLWGVAREVRTDYNRDCREKPEIILKDQ